MWGGWEEGWRACGVSEASLGVGISASPAAQKQLTSTQLCLEGNR